MLTPTDEHPGLLSLREAAQRYQVSEALLQHWVDSGMLERMSEGASLEPRFRPADVADLIERTSYASDAQNPIPRAPENAALPKSELMLEGISIEYGAHICTLYENDLGRRKWAVPFLLDGLRASDYCFLVATKAVQEDILDHLRASWSEFDNDLARNRLLVTEGVPDGERMCRFVEERLVQAARAGLQNFRLVGDMSWWFAHGTNQEDLFSYERQFNREIAHRFPMVSICQYDARDFSGQGILSALKCHEDTFDHPLSQITDC